MDEKDEKRQPIVIETKGLTLIERVKLQMKTLHDFLDKEMPEHGWMYNKGVCCKYDDLPDMFVKWSSLYAQLDLDRWEKETTMFLLISVLLPGTDLCSFNYLINGNKQKLLKYLSDDSKAEEIMECILSLSKNMEKRSKEM